MDIYCGVIRTIASTNDLFLRWSRRRTDVDAGGTIAAQILQQQCKAQLKGCT